jgi:myxalamid-type nonribosomal peptide synthetase MxaA
VIQTFDEWVAQLLTSEQLLENALYPFAAILEEFEEDNMQLPTCDTTRAQAKLAGTGVECPPVDGALIRKYLDYLINVGYLNPPPAPRSGVPQSSTTPGSFAEVDIPS